MSFPAVSGPDADENHVGSYERSGAEEARTGLTPEILLSFPRIIRSQRLRTSEIKLAYEFQKRGPAFQFRALFEGWTLADLIREMN